MPRAYIKKKHLVLSEYECGRAQMAIEWVARSQKPIVEIGGRPVEGCNLQALARDLNRCIAQSREAVRAFIMPDAIPEYCCYGFYRYPWAMKAMIAVWGAKQLPKDPYHWLWLQGLLFGYSADAIQRFIQFSSQSQGSNLPYPQHNSQVLHSGDLHPQGLYFQGKVGIYGFLAQRVRHRNSESGKYPKHD